MIKPNGEPITVSIDVFKNESKLRQVIDFFDTQFIGNASKVNYYSKDFIRETWNKIEWMEIFHYWYLRYEYNHLKDFADFMLTIDPEQEFFKK